MDRVKKLQKSPGLARSGEELGSIENLNSHKRSLTTLISKGVPLREDVPNVSKGEDQYFKSNKIFTNIYKEEEAYKHEKSSDDVPFAGANNKFSQHHFTNRNNDHYSAAYPTYLRLQDKDSK